MLTSHHATSCQWLMLAERVCSAPCIEHSSVDPPSFCSRSPFLLSQSCSSSCCVFGCSSQSWFVQYTYCSSRVWQTFGGHKHMLIVSSSFCNRDRRKELPVLARAAVNLHCSVGIFALHSCCGNRLLCDVWFAATQKQHCSHTQHAFIFIQGFQCDCAVWFAASQKKEPNDIRGGILSI